MRRLLLVAAAAVLAVSAAGPAAADSGSGMLAWGSNNFGQLGTGAGGGFTPRPVLEGALAGKRVTSVSGGTGHSCAIADGELFCWGAGGSGRLGTGSNDNAPVPVAVAGLAGTRVTAVSAGNLHTCAVADGSAYCWGSDTAGQLGNGDGGNSSVPVEVGGLLTGKTVTSITTGQNHTCAIADGAAYCWGVGNLGALGNDALDSSPVPVAVQGMGNQTVTSIRAGFTHTCATADGFVYCWGLDTSGQLGNNSNGMTVKVATLVAGPITAKVATAVRVGEDHSCALVGGDVYCWGSDTYGQLGNGPGGPVYSPELVAGLPAGKVTALTAGARHTCAIADGAMYCWGRNDLDQLGTYTSGLPVQTPTPVVLPAGSEFRSFSAGANHTLLLTAQVPTVPRAVAASAGPGSVTVSWEAPKDDGGRAITGYRVSPPGGSCESAGTSCTVSGLVPGQYTFDVVARNSIGGSAAATVSATVAAVPQVVVKSKQSFSVPKKLKKRGTTVVVRKGAMTSAGLPVTTTVKTNGKVKVIRKGGVIKVKPLGKKWRVTVTLIAPGTDTHEPFSQKVVYKNGKRR